MSTGQTENQIKTTKVMEECLLPPKKNLLVFFGGLEFSLTLVIGDEDACGAPKLLLRDVSFIKLQLFVVLKKTK
jgi:hypothetical protein